MKVLILGYGNLGKTIARGLLQSGYIIPENLFVVTKSLVLAEDQLDIPESNFFYESFPKTSFDLMVLAVKPQDFLHAIKKLQFPLPQEVVILSVMAGISISTLQAALSTQKIVRAMPNLASKVGQGMTVFTATESVSRTELSLIQNLINTIGKSLYVQKEILLDAATAISGSGPAYVYYMMESMIEAAVQLGFSAAEAELLVTQTFLGATDLKMSLGISARDLIKQVASKGGTTERALQIFQEKIINTGIIEGVLGANERAIELGKNR